MERHHSRAVKRQRTCLHPFPFSITECNQGLYIHRTEAEDDGLSLFTLMCYFGKFTSAFNTVGLWNLGEWKFCSWETCLHVLNGCFLFVSFDPCKRSKHSTSKSLYNILTSIDPSVWVYKFFCTFIIHHVKIIIMIT